MVQYCHEVGGHILLTHAGGRLSRPGSSGTLEQSKGLVKLGAYIEVATSNFVGDAAIWPISNPPDLPDWLRAMGSTQGIVMSTDLGQPSVVNPIEGYRLAIRNLIHSGISKEDLNILFQKNARAVLYLD